MNFSFEKKFNDLNEFVEYWSSFYNYSYDEIYLKNISDPYNEDAIELLFKWKNGGDLSEDKKISVKNNHSPEEFMRLANIYKGNNDQIIFEFLESQKFRPIWNIFMVHCIAPYKFPIFDQHTFRAMMYMKGKSNTDGSLIEIPRKAQDKIRYYIAEYIPFYKDLSDQMGYTLHTCIDEKRKLDRALFKYGQFLKNYGSNKPRVLTRRQYPVIRLRQRRI